MGVPVINIYDFDDVEIHNIPNQYYDTGDLGKLKAEALADKLRLINPDITVNVGKEAVTPEDVSKMSGYLFSLVDSMKVRKELWEAEYRNRKDGMETGRTEEESKGDERNRSAPSEPLPGENGKRGKERAES